LNSLGNALIFLWAVYEQLLYILMYT